MSESMDQNVVNLFEDKNVLKAPRSLELHDLQETITDGYANRESLTNQDWLNLVCAILAMRERHGINALIMLVKAPGDPFIREFFTMFNELDIKWNPASIGIMRLLRTELATRMY